MGKRAAIVTGSSRGIGEAIARRLAAENHSVCINDVEANKPGIDALVSSLNSQHGEGTAIGVVADVSSRDSVQHMIDETVSAFGALHVMVANAGIAQVAPALEVSEEDVSRMFNVNFMGVWNCYTAAGRQMIKQGAVAEGEASYKILGCASIVAFKPFPLLAHYSASKWAVRGLTQVFAMEMAQHQIRVNAYAPGIVGTAMWDLIDEKLGEQQGREKGESVKFYSSTLTALGRVSTPEDVGNVVGGFMVSKDSDFVTGQTIVIDGGIIFT